MIKKESQSRQEQMFRPFVLDAAEGILAKEGPINKKIIVIALVIIVVAAGFWLAPRFLFNKPATDNATDQQTGATDQPAQKDTPFTEEQSVKLSQDASDEFDFAFSEARKWRDDSVFIATLSRYTGSIDPDNGKNTYVFMSPSLDAFYWTIDIQQADNVVGEKDFQRIIYYTEDYFLPYNVVPAAIEYWKLNYVEAIETADRLGGKEIRAEYANLDVNALLMQPADGYIKWEVEYLVDNRSVYSVSIDAFSGESS